MDKAMIEALKRIEKPFVLLSADQRAWLLNCKKDIVLYVGVSGWRKCLSEITEYDDYNSMTFSLDPDYQLTPSLIECEVYKNPNGYLVFDNKTKHSDATTSIKDAMCCFNFVGFKYEDGMVSPHSRLYSGKLHGKQFFTAKEWAEFMDEDFEVLTPTHVLFSESK
jgi:hypothetical protein